MGSIRASQEGCETLPDLTEKVCDQSHPRRNHFPNSLLVAVMRPMVGFAAQYSSSFFKLSPNIASRNLDRGGDNRSIRARRRATWARRMLTAINATPTANAAAKPRKATSQTFQSPIESVVGALAQSSPGGALRNGLPGQREPRPRRHANTWPGLPRRHRGVMPVPCKQRETRRRRSEPDRFTRGKSGCVN
jgi:hypothetical protein